MSDDHAHLVEHRLSGTTLLSGGFIEVCRDDVRLPDGKTATREFIRHPGAVAVIPLLDDGRCVLVRQYRYPIQKILLEWPAGKLDAGERTVACAMRELQEETGYRAAEWAYGGEIHNAAAYSDESIWLWFARGLQAGAAQLDEGEFVETVLMTPDEVDAANLRGELPDVKTQIGLSWLQRWQSGHRSLNWRTAAQVLADRSGR
jgi:ADP-ribose pyrophosphatase